MSGSLGFDDPDDRGDDGGSSTSSTTSQEYGHRRRRGEGGGKEIHRSRGSARGIATNGGGEGDTVDFDDDEDGTSRDR